MSFFSKIQQWYRFRSLRPIDLAILDAVREALPPEDGAMFLEQFRAMTKVVLLRHGKEVNLYPERSRTASAVRLLSPQYGEFVIATASVSQEGKVVGHASVWIANGWLFSIEYSFVPSGTAATFTLSIELTSRPVVIPASVPGSDVFERVFGVLPVASTRVALAESAPPTDLHSLPSAVRHAYEVYAATTSAEFDLLPAASIRTVVVGGVEFQLFIDVHGRGGVVWDRSGKLALLSYERDGDVQDCSSIQAALRSALAANRNGQWRDVRDLRRGSD